MRDSFLRSFSFSSDSWLTRLRENLREAFTRVNLFPSSVNGAPIHLLASTRSGKAGRAQTASLLAHSAAIAAILLLAIHPPKQLKRPLDPSESPRPIFAPPPPHTHVARPSLGGDAGGGNRDPVPTTRGFFAPRSAMQVIRPRLPDKPSPELPVPAIPRAVLPTPAGPPLPVFPRPWLWSPRSLWPVQPQPVSS